MRVPASGTSKLAISLLYPDKVNIPFLDKSSTEITSPLQEDADPEQEEDDDNLPGVDDDGEGPFEGPVVEDEELEEADAEEPKDEDAEPEEEKTLALFTNQQLMFIGFFILLLVIIYNNNKPKRKK